MSRVVVAGASGLLGREVARSLLGRGHDVVALYRRSLPDDLVAHGQKILGAREE